MISLAAFLHSHLDLYFFTLNNKIIDTEEDFAATLLT